MSCYSIGKNVMNFRRNRKMTIREFSKYSGISTSLISQIERGQANPSLEILTILSKALNVPLYSLFLEDVELESLISRKKDRKTIYFKNDDQCLYDVLTPDFIKTHIEMLMMDLYPNSATTKKYFVHQNKEELAVLMNGSVFVELDNIEFELYEGDLVRIPPNIKHRFINKSMDLVATVLFVLTPAIL